MTIRSNKSDAQHIPCVIILDHHPADSRTEIVEDQETMQTLTSRMGTGGGNVPMILVTRNDHNKSVVINSSGDDVCGTIDSNYYKGSGSRGGIEREFVVYEITSAHKER